MVTSGASKGSLVVVGTGIQVVNHLTHEAKQCIEQADRVLHVVSDYPTHKYIESLNPNSQSLTHLYGEGKHRKETYRQMVDAILEQVRAGFRVCAVFYGHPGVFVNPSHEAIRVAKSEGFDAHMLPGLSAEDCLFADLGFDPGDQGCQSYEATDFLICQRKFDQTSALILWQIGAVGVPDAPKKDGPGPYLGVLVETLEKYYGRDYEVIVYECSPFPYPFARPSIQRTTIGKLPQAMITQLSTLYVPPKPSTFDKEMMRRLGMTPGV